MNNKKVQAQMQIDVSFINKSKNLAKDVQDSLKGLDLSSSLFKSFETDLTKSFKDTFTNLDKMSEGLGKKGLNSKIYQDFFDKMNVKVEESTRLFGALKKNIQDVYNSEENKKALKDLQAYQSKLEKINKLASSKRGAETRANTASTKLLNETGLDYNNAYVKRKVDEIALRRAGKGGTTANQQEWLNTNNIDEEKLKRVLELVKQIRGQTSKSLSFDEEANSITGKGNVSRSQDFLNSKVSETSETAITETQLKKNLSVITQIDNETKALYNTNDTLYKDWNQELPEATAEAEKLAKASGTIREVLAQFGVGFSAANIVRGFQDLAKSAIDFYKSLDSALNEIYIVSDLSSNAVNGLKNNFIGMAKETGMALDDVTRSAVLFYQQGLNTDEVLEMTKVTSQFAKVAGIDATDAADKLTSAVNGYCLNASDAATVADKFNKVAAASAANIDELSTAFSKAASQANQAGVSMDNYLSYIATMEEATREAPENIGTSLKTIFSRMDAIKSGDNTEDSTDVNDVETALNSVGVQLRDTTGQLRDLEDVFDELGPKWQTLDRNTQSYLGTIIAGTRQQSRFITLMQNWDRVLELSDESASSAGQQALMHAKAMDSIESKSQQFQVAWQEFISNLTSSDVIKTVITVMTKFVNLLNSGNKPVTLMATAIGALSSKLKDLQDPIVKKWQGLIKSFKESKESFGGLISSKEKNASLSQNKTLQQVQTSKLNSDQSQLQDLIAEQQKLSVQKDITEEEQKQLQLVNNSITSKTEEISVDKQNLAGLKEKEESIKSQNSKGEALGASLKVAGIATSALGVSIGQIDDNLGGIVSSAGSLMTTVGQFASGNYIGAIVSSAAAAYQIFQVWANWNENTAAKITDAVNEVDSSITKLANLNTGIKSGEDLIKKYEKLDNKIYKTTEEQKSLNNIAQQLSDSFDIDTIADSYGNLQINIEDVNDALDAQKAKRDEAAKDLDKTELKSALKATSGFGNNNTLEDYYSSLFKSEGSSYKSLLSGVKDGLTDEARKISSTVANTFSNNLKNSIVSEVKNNKFSYIEEGLATAMTRMEDEFNSISSSGWNDLYQEIDYLQKNVDDLTFNEVSDKLDNFYNSWGKANNLTEEQWNLLVNSINSTVFDNSSLLEFYNKVDDLQSKANGTYYEKQIKDVTEQLDSANKALDNTNLELEAQGTAAAAAAGVISTSIAVTNAWNPVGWVAGIASAISGVVSIGKTIEYYNSEEYEKTVQLKKSYKELEKAKKEALQNIVDDNPYINTTEEAQTWVNAQVKVSNTFKDLSKEGQSYLSTLTSITDFSDLTAEGSSKYADALESVSKGLESFDTNGDRYNFLAKTIEQNKDSWSQEVQQKMQAVLEEAYNNLSVSTPITFTQMNTELSSITKNLQTMNTVMAAFNETGSLSIDEFEDLAGVIDGIDISDLGSMEGGAEQINNLTSALDQLNLAYNADTGEITMNAESMKSLQSIQEVAAKSKIASLIADLKASKATTETQIAYIDAQIAGAQAALVVLQDKADGTTTAAEIENKATAATTAAFQQSTADINAGYKTDTENNTVWKTAIMTNLAKVSEAWNKYYTAVRDGSVDVDELYKNAQDSSSNLQWEGMDSSSGIDWNQYSGNIDSSQNAQLQSQIKSYIEKLTNAKAAYTNTLDLTNTKINYLNNLYNSNLSAYGKDSSKNSELDAYIGKLKEVYNIQNKISMIEHRLSTLKSYADETTGDAYLKTQKQVMSLNQELVDQYEFLTTEQKKFANGVKDAIKSSAVGDVFDFDKYGQIIINFEKYNSLTTKAANGQKSLKEQADDWYDSYTDQLQDVQDSFDKYVDAIKTVISLQQKGIDSYIDLETSAAKTIKEIYQKILDDKLDAIDQEKTALEDLEQERERAEKDAENSKSVAGLQTNLQRALIDTSGGSATTTIKAQSALEDKLDDIAKDKYSETLSDIKQQLEDQKEALQDQFDTMFENQDWLIDWLDSTILNDQDAMLDLLQQSDEWNDASKLQRQELVQEWVDKYNDYLVAGVSKGKTIYDVYEEMIQAKNSIATADEALTSTVSSTSQSIISAIQSAANTIASAASSGKNTTATIIRSGNSGSDTSAKTKNYSDSGSSGGSAVADDGSAFKVGDTVRSVGNWGAVSNYNDFGSGLTLTGFVPLVGTPVNVSIGEKRLQDGNWYYKDSGGFMKGTWFKESDLRRYAKGGLANFTGPAWLDGTSNRPEAVLDSLQTEHFIEFTDALSKLTSGSNSNNSSNQLTTGDITFQVQSMSSEEDGEKAFTAFVNKFKEIGSRSGIKIDSFKSNL